jgi:deazaflavin-dependent oxidoreductase (nitroreductase family)
LIILLKEILRGFIELSLSPSPSMNLTQQLRKSFFLVLKHTLNPLTRRMARSSLGPFSIIRHVGRRSGRQYETPLIVAPVEGGFVIELTYGPDVDWHKNIVAAGGCVVVWHGKEYPINRIKPLEAQTGLAAFPPPQRLVLRLLKRTHFEKLKYHQSLVSGN